jgi:hypothetical protein
VDTDSGDVDKDSGDVNCVAYHHSTQHAHMPKSHQAHLEWTPSRLIEWGQSVGEARGQLIRNILERVNPTRRSVIAPA